jgi:3-oxoacyl-[acyl-carrier-protein] synthase II
VGEVLKADAAPVGLWLTAETAEDPSLTSADLALDADAAVTLDLTARLGHCSGALGVLQCAAGVAHLGRGGSGSVLATSGGPADDAAAALLLTGIGTAP